MLEVYTSHAESQEKEKPSEEGLETKRSVGLVGLGRVDVFDHRIAHFSQNDSLHVCQEQACVLVIPPW